VTINRSTNKVRRIIVFIMYVLARVGASQVSNSLLGGTLDYSTLLATILCNIQQRRTNEISEREE
jgi:hypothetical protein